MTRSSWVGLAVLVTLSCTAQAQQYNISTVAGNGTAGFSGDSGLATSAQLRSPNGVAVDAHGNLYIVDSWNALVRKVTPDGKIATIAGTGISGSPGDGGPATNATFSSPWGIALDAAGSIYISDPSVHVIRKVTPDGIIHTVATNVGLTFPEGITLDSAGNLYVADFGDLKIKKVAVDGTVSVLVADDQPFRFSFGLYGPTGIAMDAAGNLYFTAPNSSLVYELSPGGYPEYVARGAVLQPTGVAVDASGNVYITDDLRFKIFKVGTGGTVTTIAGGSPGYSGDGGPATDAGIGTPQGLAVDAAGRIYFADSSHNVVRMLTPQTPVPALGITSLYDSDVNAGQTGYTYSVTVHNGDGAAPSTGAVAVSSVPTAGLTLVSMSGAGWTCSGNNCSRSDPLSGGASYPAITITLNVSSSASGTLTIQTTVSGGGSPGASDTEQLNATPLPSAPVLIAPANGAMGVSLTPTLSWNLVGGASYNIYLGTSSPPPSVASIYPGVSTYGPGALQSSTLYYWQVTASTAAGTASSPIWTFTTVPQSCSYQLSATSASAAMAGGNGSVSVTAAAGCTWTASSNSDWLTILTGASGGGNGTVNFSAAPNLGLNSRSGTLTVAGHTFTVTQFGAAILSFYLTCSGSLTQGETNAPCTIAVSNLYGEGPTSGLVTVAPGLSSGLTLASMSGTGWSCAAGSCTRSDALSVGASYPPIAVLLSVAADAPSTVFFWATVSGGGSAGGSGMELTLTVAPTTHGSCSYQLGAAGATAGTAGGNGSVSVTAPAGCPWTASGNSTWLTILTGASGSGNGTVTYSVASNAGSGSRSGILTIAGQTFTVTQAGVGAPLLSVTLTRSGNLTQGQTNASYTITVSNQSGAGATSGAVTVAEALSSGLTLVSMSGTGWSCGSGSCTRADVLNAGASYPAITVLVNVAASAPSPVTNQVAVSGGGSAAASATDLAAVSSTLPVPSINPGGLANAASFAPGAPVAPGSIVAAFGNFQVSSPSAASNLPLPTSLSGLTLQFNDLTNAPLFYASSGQVNLQVPWELAGQPLAPLIATLGGQTSATQMVNLAPFAPGIFTTSAQGTGQGAILDTSYRLVDASNPAAPGSVVVIYCTGLGAVSNQPASGSPAPSDPLSETLTKPTVTIGGATVTAAFAGLVPGLVGEYQVNAEVPAGSATGNAVPVAITIGGVSSNTVTMAVKAAE